MRTFKPRFTITDKDEIFMEWWVDDRKLEYFETPQEVMCYGSGPRGGREFGNLYDGYRWLVKADGNDPGAKDGQGSGLGKDG